MDFPQLIGSGFYTPFSQKAESQTCRNLYLETIESGQGRNQFALYRSPGLKPFVVDGSYTPTKKVCRGLLLGPNNSSLFDVQDDTIREVLSDGNVNASYGPLADDGQLVSIDESLNSLFVVSSGILYRVNGAALTTPATDFVPAAVAVISGLVVALEVGTNRFYFSTDDGATWDPLDFQTAEAYPNTLINLVVDHQELWLFGNRRTQVFVVSGDPNAPFSAVQAGVIEMGLGAKNAITKLDNSIFWFGSNRDGDHMVWRANGYSPQRVSNHAVENALRGYARHDDLIMSSYQINGHSCIRLTSPSANDGLGETWEYDVSTGQWYQPAWWNPQLNQYERWRGNAITAAFQTIIVGDHSNGFLYTMSPDHFTDFGYPIRWERRTPHSTKDGKRIQYRRFGLFMQTGVGSETPIWINDRSLQAAAFAAALATLVGAATISAAQAIVMQAIYDYQPYDQDLALPDPSIMTPLGFFDLASDPMVSMRYSNDGGFSWSAWRDRPLGQAGDYNKRIYWPRLGMGRDRVWEISGTAPVKTAIVQGSFDAVVCDS